MESKTAYLKAASYEAHKGTFDRCLLLYSGGLDTSVMLKWIQVEYSCQVVALTIDIGQTADDLNAIKAKAIKLGAIDCIVYDAKEEFADTLLSEAIKANADYQGGYALGCPLGRVMISQVTTDTTSPTLTTAHRSRETDCCTSCVSVCVCWRCRSLLVLLLTTGVRLWLTAALGRATIRFGLKVTSSRSTQL
jgi:Arginosuccinate synthase N-terminal HUP domain